MQALATLLFQNGDKALQTPEPEAGLVFLQHADDRSAQLPPGQHPNKGLFSTLHAHHCRVPQLEHTFTISVR